ncbi:MAG: sporulation protein YqfD [Lachnospiraceae bacterium]|nr:sporulation protein YqfD [Lachnospiraceae bacterium]MDE6626882.1 sporulation protein YqfD [Lachnospiraceae bacterium]
MLLTILRYIFGYVKAEIYGFAPERFMNLIIKNDIVVWDIEGTEKGYIFYTGRRNLMLMKPFLQKTNMKIKILEKYGLPYFLRQNKRRAGFLIGFLFFCLMVYILSLFVWEVKVTGENKLVADNLLRVIEEEYVPLGTLKAKINCSELETALRKQYDEISWISCELKGTGLTVYLEEGMAPKMQKDSDVTGDMVAAKDAQIIKMITRQGTPVVKVKDTVKKGDILISGTIYIYDDNNEIMETSHIAADGDVYGVTTEGYEDYVDIAYYEKEYQGTPKTHITFYFLDYCLTPYIPKIDAENFDSYTQIHKAKILDNFYLPFGYKTVKRTPYQLKKAEYSDKEAKKILEERLQKKLQDFEQKGVEIIENNVTIEKSNGRMTAKGTIVKNEPIAILQSSSGKHKEKKD